MTRLVRSGADGMGQQMRLFCRAVVALILFATIGGCETNVPPRKYPDLRYTHLPPIRLDAVRVDVVRKYRPTAAKPHVEHEFPVQPATVATNWARDRLQAAGVGNIVRATVVDAGVVEVPMKRTTGVTGVFTTDQSERYDGTLEIMIEIIGPDGRRLAMVSSKASRSRTVPENITLANRETAWFRMTESMMNDVNLALERQIREHFRPWLR